MKSTFLSLATVAALFLTAVPAVLAANPESAADKQRRLIAVLQSDAPPQDKAIPCKQLAIYGNKDAVPALAPLLANKDLASWARIALEAIPGPEADEALRNAAAKLEGSLLIGAINSLGVRRDAQAVPVLAGKLRDPKLEIVNAAAVAIGKIGGPEAARVLQSALATPDLPTLAAVSEGGIQCAERFLTDGKFSEAIQMYDAVRKTDVPKQRWLEATRGAILSRQSAGLPLLLEYLRSPARAEFALALRTARELKGVDVTEAIAAELDRAGAERGVMLLLALADRNDAAVLPKLLQVARGGAKPARMAVLGLLDRYSDPAAVPVLLDAAADADLDVASPAKATLTRLEGKPVDDALLSRLPESSGRNRQMIIELVALRRIHAAVPAIARNIADPDAGVRRAALATLGALGTEQQAGDLVQALAKTSDATEREAIESALNTICGRSGARCLPSIQPLARNDDSELRKVALRACASMGGREGLAAVVAAVSDRDESVQDEAVGTLATWPNNWPDDSAVAEPLLDLVKSGRKRAHQIQGARGYLLHVQENKKLALADKLSAIDQLLPSLKQPAEKRLAIATLAGIPTAKTLSSLGALAEDPAIAEEACLALVNLATAKSLEDSTPTARRTALQKVIDKSRNDATRKKASDALKSMP